jgi:outer membrane protein TolC
MRLKQQKPAVFVACAAAALTTGLFASGRQVFASEQPAFAKAPARQAPAFAKAPARQAPAFAEAPARLAPAFAEAPARQAPQTPTPAAQPPQPTGPEVTISADDAVKMALENNMAIQTERLSPQVQALALQGAHAAYAPTLFSNFSRSASTTPPTDFLSAGVASTTSGNMRTDGGLQQALRWGGGSYAVSMAGGKSTTDALRAVFSPQLSSSINAQYTQPLLRNFRIDNLRQNLLQQRNQLEVAEIQLAARITQTSRTVRTSYFNLVQAIAARDVAQQSLDLARESLRQNERRVEVGTMAQIDILEAQAEVSRQEESLIIAESNIRAAEDTLRTLVMNPSQPDFWTTRLTPTERPTMTAQAVDVEAAIGNALKNRTDLLQTRKQLESADISIRYASDQKLPALNLQATYGVSGIGGTQNRWSGGFGDTPPIIESSSQRSFADVLRDVFGNDFRTWSIALNFSYPIGTSIADAALAQGRVERQQATLSLREQEMAVVAQVREAGRQVSTTQQRVEATRKAREFAERRYEAEQKRVTVGLSTTFQMLQAQRDLDAARQSELRALIDYSRALVNFEAVQVVPLGGF